MGLGDVIVQGGLLSRDVDTYNDQQSERGLRLRQIQAGIQRMDDDAAMRPARMEIDRLKQDIERTELQYRQRTRAEEEGMRDTQRSIVKSDLTHQATMQPGAQELGRMQQTGQIADAKTATALQPGNAQLAQAQQGEQLRALKEQQFARLWSLYKSGDEAGFLDMLNNSSIVAPGRKFGSVKQITVPSPTGQQVPALQFEAADGGQSITVPMTQLAQLEQKYGSKVEKVGNNLVRIGPDGKATPIYEQDAYAATRDGTIYSKSSGAVKTVGTGASGSAARKTGRETGVLPDKWLENFEKDGLPKIEALDEKGQRRPDPKDPAKFMSETDESIAPLMRDMARMNSDILARGGVQVGEAGAVFAQFAKAAKEKDKGKAYASLDGAGRLAGVTDKNGVIVNIKGRIGTAQDGSPIYFDLPTGLERLLMDQALENAFQNERAAAAVDEGQRLRRRAPADVRQRSASGPIRPAAAAGVNP